MAEAKRYYWLKLKDDFFNSKRIKKLRKMAGGDTYTIIYLKMQLLAMKTDGMLTFTGLEDDFADELALDLDESPDDVKVTLAFLMSCGLAETSDNVSFFFPFSVENVGSENASAQRVREHRKRQEALQCNTDVTPMKQICNGEIEIEKEIDIRDRDKSDISPAPAKPQKHKYGEYKNVLLTDDELQKLRDELPDADGMIERLSAYIASTGKSYKSHYATIRNWAARDKLNPPRVDKPKPAPQQEERRTASYSISAFEASALNVPDYQFKNKKEN